MASRTRQHIRRAQLGEIALLATVDQWDADAQFIGSWRSWTPGPAGVPRLDRRLAVLRGLPMRPMTCIDSLLGAR